MSLFTTLSIGREAMSTSQVGLQVTGQNIANVNTEGYKRQQTNQQALPYGLGVRVDSISRILDPMVEKRLLGATTTSNYSGEIAQTYKTLEDLFNEVSNRGLDTEFEEFFTALQDLASRPGGQAERATLRSRGESIGSVYEFYRLQMQDQVQATDKAIDADVSKANELIASIAELNRNITMNRNNDLGVNDLLNQRDHLVTQLAEIMPINVVEDENNQFQLYIKSGMPLVAGTHHYELESRPDPTDDMQRDVIWKSSTGVEMVITDSLREGGSLGATLETRDVIVPEQMRKLDRLATEFVMLFNEQHRAGMGLDGISNRNFFEELPVNTHIGKGNEGGAGVASAVIADVTLLTLDDYEIRFTGPAAYDVVNTTTGATVSSGAYVAGNTISFDGIDVVITDTGVPPVTGDFFTVSVVEGAAANVRVSTDITNSLDAIAAGLTGLEGDNQNALVLADMENRELASGGTVSFRDMFHQMIVELGVATESAYVQDDTQSSLHTQLSNMSESVSGVNLDEEATRLMAYQRAFQSASKCIQITDEMMETLINVI
jgi:flagellar hook-associated protein 1